MYHVICTLILLHITISIQIKGHPTEKVSTQRGVYISTFKKETPSKLSKPDDNRRYCLFESENHCFYFSGINRRWHAFSFFISSQCGNWFSRIILRVIQKFPEQHCNFLENNVGNVLSMDSNREQNTLFFYAIWSYFNWDTKIIFPKKWSSANACWLYMPLVWQKLTRIFSITFYRSNVDSCGFHY